MLLRCDSFANGMPRGGVLHEESEMAGNDLGSILKRIDKRLEAVGLTDRAASMAAGMSPDGIRTMRRQWLAKKQRTATAHTLGLLARPLQTTTEYLMNGIGAEDIRDVRVQAAKVAIAKTNYRTAKRAAKGKQRGVELGGALQVSGEVVAGTWKENIATAEAFDLRVPAHPDYALKHQFAVVVRGNSVSRVASYNDVLIALDVAESGAMPRSGDLVIVARNRAGLYEYTAKRYCVSDDGKSVELRYDSLDPQFGSGTMLTLPVTAKGLGDKADDGSEIEIKGIVLLVVRVP
jgi:hypothetical protein